MFRSSSSYNTWFNAVFASTLVWFVADIVFGRNWDHMRPDDWEGLWVDLLGFTLVGVCLYGFKQAQKVVNHQQKQDQQLLVELEQARHSAEQANAQKGEFLAVMSMDDCLFKPVRKKELAQKILYWVKGGEQSRALDDMEDHEIDLSGDLGPESLESLRKLMGDRFSRTIQFYLEDSANYIQALREAVERRDYAGAIRPAHSLKSSSRQIGATDFGKLAEQVEHDARLLSQSTGDEKAFVTQATALCDKFAPLQQSLKGYLQAHPNNGGHAHG